MADDPKNHTLRLLREMRDEAVAFRKEVNCRFDVIDERFNAIDRRLDGVDRRFDGVDHRLSELEVSLASARADQHRTNELLETVVETQKNQGARLNVIEGRLALIEKHTGLVQA
jgi:septal ring factor EnvC (AmiA/AmiB activator)